jgi:ribosomal RNA-processing protein 7
MSSERSSKKLKSTTATPKSVSGFAVLPITLPSLSGLPTQCAAAQHYLYIKPHEPSVPTPTADRSLFVSNVPFDASESNIRALFTEQLGGSRVEHVEFDSAIPAVQNAKRFRAEALKGGAQAGKKRKRDDAEVVAEGVVEDEESALPRVWKGELRKSGGCAVVVFVDRASCKGAWKEVKSAVKEGREVRWDGGGGEEDVVLGIQRKLHLFVAEVCYGRLMAVVHSSIRFRT